MSDVAARTPHLPHSPSLPTAVRESQGSQLRVIFWKEWREQRLVLFALFLAQALVFVVPRLRDVAHLCFFVVPWVVGAAVAGGEHVSGTRLFVTTNPVRLAMLWLAKLLVGLGATVAFGAAFVLCASVFTDLWPSPKGVSLRDLAAIVTAGLFCFSLSHYCGCWMKSAISALGLSVALVVCLLACWLFNPVSLYISNYGQAWLHPVLIVIFVLLLSRLGRSRFMDTVSRQGQFTRCQRAWWFAQPVVLFGVLPFLGGAVVLAFDVWRFDPTDVHSFRLLSVAPDGDRIMAGGSYWQAGPWLKWRNGSAAVVVSASSSDARRLRLPRGVRSTWLGPWSPSGRHLALALWSPRTSGTGVLDTETGGVDILQEGFAFPYLAWLSDDELAFSSHHAFPSAADAVSASPEGLRRGWGVWRAGGADNSLRPFPDELEQVRARCLGILTDPARIVFSNARENHSDPALFVFDIASQRLDRIKSPFRKCGCTLLPGCERVLVSPYRSEAETGPERPPQLLRLATGKGTCLEDVLGEPPERGWAAWRSWPTRDGRWLLSVPRDQAETPSLGWYAVDLRGDRAFYHARPTPHVVPMSASDSGRLAYAVGTTTRGFAAVCVQPLRDTDPTARLVLAPAGDGTRGWVNRFDWVNEDELVLGITVRPSEPSRQVLEAQGWAGIVVANVSTKRVRPLWIGKGLTVQWRFMDWDQWQRCRHAPHRANLAPRRES